MTTEVHDVTETYHLRGEDYVVTAPARFDQVTGKQIFDEQLDDAAVNAALSMYRKAHKMVTPEQIVELRKSFGLSQRGFATLLGWSPTTVANYETGALPSNANNQLLQALIHRPQFANELFALSKQKMTKTDCQSFKYNQQVSTAELTRFFVEPGVGEQQVAYTERAGYSAFAFDRFEQMALYFITAEKKLDRDKLNRLLFYADFTNFRTATVSMSGSAYIRLATGPVPQNYDLLYGFMQQRGSIKVTEVESGTSIVEQFSAQTDFLPSMFTADELGILAAVARRFAQYTTHDLVTLTHREKAWINSDQGQLISYYDAAGMV